MKNSRYASRKSPQSVWFACSPIKTKLLRFIYEIKIFHVRLLVSTVETTLNMASMSRARKQQEHSTHLLGEMGVLQRWHGISIEVPLEPPCPL